MIDFEPYAGVPGVVPLAQVGNTLLLRSLVAPDDTDQTAAIRSMLLLQRDYEAQGIPTVVDASGGTWRISDDFVIDWANFRFKGGTFDHIDQGKAVFRVFGDGAQISGITSRFVGTRTPVSGNYYGTTGMQRAAAIVLHGSYALIENIRVENRHVGINIRGPVQRRDGTPALINDGGAVIDYSKRALNNTIRNISGDTVDFLITGMSQDDLLIDGVNMRHTTFINGQPPHALYMRSGGEGTIYEGVCNRVTVRNFNSYDNGISQAFKASNWFDFTIDGFTCDRVAGAMVLSNCRRGLISNVNSTNTLATNYASEEDDDGIPYALGYVLNCADIEFDGALVSGLAGQRFSTLQARRSSRRIAARNVSVVDSQPADVATGHFRAAEGSDLTLTDCKRSITGAADTDTITAAQMSRVTVNGFIQTGKSTKLLNCDATSAMRGAIDPLMIDGYSSGMLRGTVPNIRVSGVPMPFTPTLNSAVSGQEVAGYAIQSGWWTLAGGRVFLDVRIDLNAAPGLTAGDGLEIRNLPLAVIGGGSGPRFSGNVVSDNVTPPAGSGIGVQGRADTTSLTLRAVNGVSRPALTAAALSATSRMDVTVSYRASVIDPVPVATTAPVLSAAANGVAATPVNGSYAPAAASMFYLWERSTKLIPGAEAYDPIKVGADYVTSASYTPIASDVGKQIRRREVAVSPAGLSRSAISNAVTVTA